MKVLLANPRGFCAGVDRAIEIVNRAIELFGAPIYVRHEVVHNKFVVDNLRDKGAVFVEELDDVPEGETVIFSAHGVSQADIGFIAWVTTPALGYETYYIKPGATFTVVRLINGAP